MTTLKEFYEQFDGVERGLIDMLCSPAGNVPLIANQHLKELYKIKRDLVTIFLNPNEDSIIELFCPFYKHIKKFIDENYDDSNEKGIISRDKGRNLSFSESREEDLRFFVERGYVKR